MLWPKFRYVGTTQSRPVEVRIILLDLSGNLEALRSMGFRESARPPHSTKEWGFEPILLV